MKIMSIAIFVAFFNTGCSLFQPSVKVCGNQFRQGENLPLNYSKIDESFLKSLQQVTKNNGDVVNLPISGQDFMNSISTPAYFYWSAGFGSRANASKFGATAARRRASFATAIWIFYEVVNCAIVVAV